MRYIDDYDNFNHSGEHPPIVTCNQAVIGNEIFQVHLFLSVFLQRRTCSNFFFNKNVRSQEMEMENCDGDMQSMHQSR